MTIQRYLPGIMYLPGQIDWSKPIHYVKIEEMTANELIEYILLGISYLKRNLRQYNRKVGLK